MEHLSSIPYTNAFIQESLRLFGPVPILQRRSLVDYKFGDYTVPRGTIYILPNHFINRNENEFEEGETFLPDRFLENSKSYYLIS